jgi:hypothetical protein
MNRIVAVMEIGLGLFATPSAALALGVTFYVDAATGNDSLNDGLSPATPWKTITKGVFHAQGGDTVMVSFGYVRRKRRVQAGRL